MQIDMSASVPLSPDTGVIPMTRRPHHGNSLATIPPEAVPVPRWSHVEWPPKHRSAADRSDLDEAGQRRWVPVVIEFP
jgi:hypothetical protein